MEDPPFPLAKPGPLLVAACMQVLHLPTFQLSRCTQPAHSASPTLPAWHLCCPGHTLQQDWRLSESRRALALVAFAVGALPMLVPCFTLSAMAGVVPVPWLLAACGDIELNPGPSTPAEELANVEKQIDKLEKMQDALTPGDPAMVPLLKNLAELRKKENSLREALKGAGSTEGAQGTPPDESTKHMMEMVADMPAVALPHTSAEFEAMIHGTVGLRIPIPSNFYTALAAQLPEPLPAVLRSVPNSWAASELHRLIRMQPTDFGSELTTTLLLAQLLDVVNQQLSVLSGGAEGFKLHLNRTEKQAGSTSAATPERTRPDTLVTHSSCTMALGEDKVTGQLSAALADLQVYAKGGLHPHHYGSIRGLPAYIASGFMLQLCFITEGGHVKPVQPVLDLSLVAGRLCAVICVINLYRLLLAMSKVLPPLVSRVALWCPFVNGLAQITLTPMGAIKKIQDMKTHLRKADTTQEALKQAYQAAATAALGQHQRGQPPFLVYAQEGPTFGRAGYAVHTTPLGYTRSIETEQDARHVALACCKAAHVLHEAGVVHSDFRLPNVLWLSDSHCMVIDLEHARLADQPASIQLNGWVPATYDMVGHARCYTRRSEMHQIGRLVEQALPSNHSPLAAAFVQALLSKSLTAEAALQHPWLQPQQQQPP